MREIVAMEVFGTPYMTQAEELPIEERVFFREAIGMGVNDADKKAIAEGRFDLIEEKCRALVKAAKA